LFQNCSLLLRTELITIYSLHASSVFTSS
jgi:hypothetical protein